MNDKNPSAKKYRSDASKHTMTFFPSNTIVMTVDKNKVRKNGIVSDSLSDDKINDRIVVKLPQQGVLKNSLAVLDIVANNYDERPIYMGQTIPGEFRNMFTNHLKTVGLAPLVTPEKLTRETAFDIEKNYDLYMNKYQYRGLNDTSVYWDEVANRTTSWYRQGFVQLAEALLRRGDKERAKAVLDKYEEVLPAAEKSNGYINESYLIYLRHSVGDTAKAAEQLEKTFDKSDRELTYYARLDINKQSGISNEIAQTINALREYASVANEFNQEFAAKITERREYYKTCFPEIVKVYGIK